MTGALRSSDMIVGVELVSRNYMLTPLTPDDLAAHAAFMAGRSTAKRDRGRCRRHHQTKGGDTWNGTFLAAISPNVWQVPRR